jgi:hypothetical protein
MEDEARMALEPGADLGMLVRGIARATRTRHKSRPSDFKAVTESSSAAKYAESQLRQMPSYMKYYNGTRTHLSLEKYAPVSLEIWDERFKLGKLSTLSSHRCLTPLNPSRAASKPHAD